MKNIGSIFKTFSFNDVAHFNASLPIVIAVREKLSSAKYVLQIGNKTLQTTSYKTLKVGEKYWGIMQKSTDGAIVLSNLLYRPAILDALPSAAKKFDFAGLNTFLDSQNVFKNALDMSLQQMANAKNKQEFEFCSFVLLGLKDGVLSLAINEGKESLLQIKKTQSKLIFSALMPHLGIIKGEIYDDGTKANIKANFENSLSLLKSSSSLIERFVCVEFMLDRAIKPLFAPQGENLLSYLV